MVASLKAHSESFLQHCLMESSILDIVSSRGELLVEQSIVRALLRIPRLAKPSPGQFCIERLLF